MVKLVGILLRYFANACIFRIPSAPGTTSSSNFLVSTEKYKEFLELFPVVVNDLTNKITDSNLVEPNVRYDEDLRYLNLLVKKLRALITFTTYETQISD